MRRFEYEALGACRSLRNLALPPMFWNWSGSDAFLECKDLLSIFGTTDQIKNALYHRFDELPIHKMIYYQSYNNLTVEQLNNETYIRSGYNMRTLSSRLDPSGNQQDILGMTPLHILACSSVQNIDMYRIIIDKYPDNLITKDIWGELPLVYAIWGEVPDEIVWLLIDSIENMYPHYNLEWGEMFETVAKGDTPSWNVLGNIVGFSSECWEWIDWQSLMEKLADSTRFLDPGTGISPCAFHFLVAKAFLPRLDKLGVGFSIFINEAMTYAKAVACADRKAHLNELLLELEQYESKFQGMIDATSQLELALWNMKIEEGLQTRKRHRKAKKVDTSSIRSQCRVSCGASIVIPLVLSYLLPAEVMKKLR